MNNSVPDQDLRLSLNVIRKGGVILCPTDTIWGLSCDATDNKAIERIYSIKQRPPARSMIVLADSLAMLTGYVSEIPPVTYDLLKLSEDPLTLVLPAKTGAFSGLILSDDNYIGIRICRELFCSSLIGCLGRPIVSTSANITGSPPPAMYADISPEIINSVDYVVRYRQNEKRKGRPSAVIKIDPHGVIEVLRK